MSSHAIDPQWGESGLNLYNSNELTFLLCCIMPIFCVASTSVSAILQNPWNTGTLSKSCLAGPNWYGCILVVSRAKYQFHLRSSSWPFCSDSPEWRSRHMVMWFGHRGDAFGTTENAFFCAFITLRSVSPISLLSVSFNGNHINNHP